MASNPSEDDAAAAGSLDLNSTADRTVSSVAAEEPPSGTSTNPGDVTVVSDGIAAQIGATAVASGVGGEGERVGERVNEMDEKLGGDGGSSGASVDVDNMFVEMAQGGAEPEGVDEKSGESKGEAEMSDASEVKIAIEIEADTAEISFGDGKIMDRTEIGIESGSEDKDIQTREVEVPQKRGRGRPRRSPQAGQLWDDNVQDQKKELSQKRKRGRPPKSAVKSSASIDWTVDENVQILEQQSSSAKTKRGRLRQSPQAGQLGDDNAQVQEQEFSQKRQRGRPPKSAVKSKASTGWTTDENVQISEQPSSSVKRRRGRPRQSPQPGQLGDNNMQVQEQGFSQKRQRGRPPKSAVKSSASPGCTTDENVHISEQPSSSVKRKRGRPPKLAKLSTLNADQIPCENAQTPIQQSSLKRQRGRPRRPSVARTKSNDLAPGEITVVLDKASPVNNAIGSSAHVDDNLQHNSVQAGEFASSLKKKRGRPPRSASGSSQQTSCTQYESAQVEGETLPVKKKRGRPRLFALYSTGDVGQLQDKNRQVREEESVMRRKRGRPRRIRMVNTDPVRYYCHFQDESNGFVVSNLVWGKVKSHPWWPGQIFDASNASEMAMNIEKKNHFLVAYFGDRTFAWCNESQLKPFQTDFAEMEKENSTYAFLNAVDDALDEVSRQIELGMACSCLDTDSYASLMSKNVENSGVREGTISSVCKSWIVNSFQPAELVDYVRTLAQAPYKGADRLEFVIANAQLKAFNHSKGHPELPVYVLGDQLENDDQNSPSKNMESDHDAAGPSRPDPSDCTPGMEKSRGKCSSSLNRKDDMEDGWKKRSLSELMEENTDVNPNKHALGYCSHSSSRKPKIFNTGISYRVKTTKKKRLDSLGDVKAKTVMKQLNVGEHMHQIAEQFAGSPHMLKCNGQTVKRQRYRGNHKRQSGIHHDCPQEEQPVSKDYTSPSEILSLLCLVAVDPLKRYSFLSTVISFFSDFKQWISSSSSGYNNHTKMASVVKRGRRKFMNLNPEHADLGNAEYTQDSYWPDIIVSDDPEKREDDSQIMKQLDDEPAISLALDLMSLAKEQLQVDSVTTNPVKDLKGEKSLTNSDEEVEECMPTELILRMSDSDNFPVVADLIKFFGRYGPLRVGETEVIEETKFAKVVFKRRADAELALSNAGECSIFGQASVSYRLRYLESPPETSPIGILDSQEV